MRARLKRLPPARLARRAAALTLSLARVHERSGSIIPAAQDRTPLAPVSTAWHAFTNDRWRSHDSRWTWWRPRSVAFRWPDGERPRCVSAAQFTRLLLVGGRYDGSAAAWKDAERERCAGVFAGRTSQNRLALIGRRGADVSAKTLPALKGEACVAIVEGYSHGDTVETNRGGVPVRATQSEEDSLSRNCSTSAAAVRPDGRARRPATWSATTRRSPAREAAGSGSTPLVKRGLYGFALQAERARTRRRSINQIQRADPWHDRGPDVSPACCIVDWINATSMAMASRNTCLPPIAPVRRRRSTVHALQ